MPGIVFRAAMAAYAARYWMPVTRHAARPERAQERVLREHPGRKSRPRNLASSIGSPTFATPEQFRERVPVQDYETLRAYIERQRCTGAAGADGGTRRCSTRRRAGRPASPSTFRSAPSALRIHRAEQALFTYLQYRACPAAFSGKALGIMGAAVEGRLDSGHDVGSVSGYLYESLPAAVQSRFVAAAGDLGASPTTI